MRSNGGICSFERAAGTPISLLESGPVAGVTAAAEFGRQLGARHVLALDIGGTTAKTSAVRDGQVRVDSLHHVGKTPVFAGYPVQSPTVEIIEIAPAAARSRGRTTRAACTWGRAAPARSRGPPATGGAGPSRR